MTEGTQEPVVEEIDKSMPGSESVTMESVEEGDTDE